MKSYFLKLEFLFLILLLSFSSIAQNPEGFDNMAKNMADKTVPIIKSSQVVKLQQKSKEIVFLDARELEEYEMSHIKNSILIGYDDFDIKSVIAINKNSIIVIYCSVGYRSGKIGKQLREMGFTSVFNLYGGLFDWANNGNIVVNESGETKYVHPYNTKWGKWLKPELRGKTK
ncbi:rhodanese-like domain-containing protein [Flavobacteriales bacterium]|jgi:rhodanese-related sulfurtransferase|nr:rhodanese-like domain-containing protein [Flavobacteriales bacterium]